MKNCLPKWKAFHFSGCHPKKYKPNLLFIVLLLFGFSSPLFAQQAVTGRVTSSDTALAGVSVKVKGSNVVTQTNDNGEFTVNAPANSTLIFSSIGYGENEINIGNRSVLQVNMLATSREMEQVVVVGYGTQRKSDLTGSIASLTAKDIKNEAVTNLQTALVGKLAGVYAATSSGQPGSGAMIRIRGFGTINNNDPLYVVDGQFLSDINNINPNDIERLEVLKDASATAIYGSRGSNGVVVITTKKGISGEPVVSFDGYVGGTSSTFVPEASDNTQLYNFLKESYENDGLAFPDGITRLYQRGVNTDWWDVTTRTGLTQNYNVSVQGGNDKLKSILSLGYLEDNGFIRNTMYNRFTARWNSEYKLSSRITLGANMSLIGSKQRNMDGFSEPIWQIISADPFSYVYSPWVDETAANYRYNKYAPTEWAYTDNPLFLLESNNAYTKKLNLFGSAYANVKLFKGLSYNAQFSFDRPSATGNTFLPSFNAVPSELNMGRLKFRNQSMISSSASNSWNTIWQNTLNFNRDFGSHHLTALAGITFENNRFETISGSKSTTPGNDPAYWVINAGTTAPNVNGNVEENSILSYLGRINYSFDDRYLATVSFRADGSSRFTEDNRWGYFPSFSLGWKLSNESFFQNMNINAISDLKIRAGWGQTGNQNIDNFAAITTVGTANYQVYSFGSTYYPAYGPRNLGNAAIRWETSEQTNIGVDAELFNNRLSVTFDYFVKKTNDMLLRLPVPTYTGYPNAPFTNAGSVQNKGFDLAVNWRGQSGDFSYSVGGNASMYKNEVTSLGEGNNPIYGTGFKSALTKTEVGGPMGRFFGYKWLGIFQTQDEINAYQGKDGSLLQPLALPGDFKFADTDGNGVINDDDRVYIGSPHPDLYFGFNFNLAYKQFDLSSSFTGSAGNDMWNEHLAKYFVSIDNVPAKAYTDAWRQAGDDTRFPRISQTNKNNNNRTSSWYVEDGSYVRLKNLQLGYTFSHGLLERTKLFSSCRIYLSGQNLLTFTKYTGMDPEVGNGSPIQQGFEITRYPASRIVSIGVNAQF